jgi:hypothetical protein
MIITKGGVATRLLFYFVYRERTTLWEAKDLDDPIDRVGSVRGKQCGYIGFSLQRFIISGGNLHSHIISIR